ncbi:MAG: hypothetical protein U0103_22000 [Candidatus Obscuribacterales bacterium]|nr:MAG: hypothetical protein EKK48_08640 [Candidatus Melainabacteria bacterium]
MFRSFCVGALLGFVFGSSKQGRDVWQNFDGILTELTSGDAMKTLDDEKNQLSKVGSENTKTRDEETSYEDSGNRGQETISKDQSPLNADKAQELADKLGAKPSTPEDENVAAFSHHDDELKSA